jgi:hypothetical protein
MCGYDDVIVGVANRLPPGSSCQLALIYHFAIWLVGRRVNELAKCDYRFCPIENRLEVRNLMLCMPHEHDQTPTSLADTGWPGTTSGMALVNSVSAEAHQITSSAAITRGRPRTPERRVASGPGDRLAPSCAVVHERRFRSGPCRLVSPIRCSCERACALDEGPARLRWRGCSVRSGLSVMRPACIGAGRCRQGGWGSRRGSGGCFRSRWRVVNGGWWTFDDERGDGTLVVPYVGGDERVVLPAWNLYAPWLVC